MSLETQFLDDEERYQKHKDVHWVATNVDTTETETENSEQEMQMGKCIILNHSATLH